VGEFYVIGVGDFSVVVTIGAQAPGTGKAEDVSARDATDFLLVFFYLRFFVIVRLSLVRLVTFLVPAYPGQVFNYDRFIRSDGSESIYADFKLEQGNS